ncbi:hypothetical protein [Rhodanobacter sp. BL-MT-08]
MKRFYRVAFAGVLVVSIGVAAASGPESLSGFVPRVMPVLVRVNSHGKVTKISPSSNLSPAFERLLASDLNAWITGPAIIKGRAMDSEMIVNVALQVSPRGDGKYDTQFSYVSSSASPFPSSHWVTLDGNRLAIADDEDINPNRAPSNPSFAFSNISRGAIGVQGAVSSAPSHSK